MNKAVTLFVDNEAIQGEVGQSIMDACDNAGIYIPRLCDAEGLVPQGSCRVCCVKANGRTVAACTQPIEEDMQVENATEELLHYRRDLVRMLFQEGNHLCPGCEASGRCELQATAYRLDVSHLSKYPYLQPVRPLDASHRDIVIDSNRCIFCGRCIRASRDIDGKGVFGYVGRGIEKRLAFNGKNLAETDADIDDYAMNIAVCPVGCIIRKREGYFAPLGQRQYDQHDIGHAIEAKHEAIIVTDAAADREDKKSSS